jgi:diguanylate cyclase (GGDEF)-like protein
MGPGHRRNCAPTHSDAARSAAPAAPTGQRPHFGIRRATWVVWLVVVALLFSNGVMLWSLRHQVLQQAAGDAYNLTQIASGQFELVALEANRVLDAVLLSADDIALGGERLQRARAVVAQLKLAALTIGGIYVHDAQGNRVLSSVVGAPPLNIAERELFVMHRDRADVRTTIGAPFVGYMTGEWLIPFSRRINDAHGGFNGVALVTVPVKSLGGLLAPLDLGVNRLLVTVADWKVIDQSVLPHGAKRPVEPGSLTSRIAAGVLDPIVGHALVQDDKIISYRRLHEYRTVVVVEAEMPVVLAGWQRLVVAQLALALLVLGMLGLAGGLMQQAQRRRRLAEEGLRQARDDLAQANTRLAHLAQHDALTDLPNRRLFQERCTEAFRQAQRESRPLALVMIDVDAFKAFNDRYGHVEGDQCLKQVAHAVQSVAARPQDLCARYGGEELVLLLPETAEDGAVAVAEQARQAVLDLRIVHADGPAGVVTISLGVAASVPQASDTQESLLRAADAALYRAKQAGKNQVQRSSALGGD